MYNKQFDIFIGPEMKIVFRFQIQSYSDFPNANLILTLDTCYEQFCFFKKTYC